MNQKNEAINEIKKFKNYIQNFSDDNIEFKQMNDLIIHFKNIVLKYSELDITIENVDCSIISNIDLPDFINKNIAFLDNINVNLDFDYLDFLEEINELNNPTILQVKKDIDYILENLM